MTETHSYHSLPVRVRFAPSPTGMLHLGGARTAIYNWAFARANGGTFVLRIEDTDPERSTKENTDIIIRALRWMGLTWDEGPEIGGEFGPYFQTQRVDTYEQALDYLRRHDGAYPCFCTKKELDVKRARAEAKEGGYGGYDRTCRSLSPEVAQARIDAGEPHVWRLKVPLDHGAVTFHDAVYGPMSFPIDAMDDMVIRRTDGSFTYNFAVVCDDVNMAMTHIIRGDDHLSNTPRQVLIYEALGSPVPEFAHLPMILGPDGHKLSKRHGATSVEEYRDRGFLPAAMVNYLALLGWSLDGETTIITPQELCEHFSLDRINKKDAVFDEKKLAWMNGVYLRNLSPEQWVDVATPWLVQTVITSRKLAETRIIPTRASETAEQVFHEIPMPDLSSEATQATALTERPLFLCLYPLIIERLNRLDEIPDKLAYIFWGPQVELDQKSVEKVLLKDGAGADKALRACRDVLADETIPWLCDSLQLACRALCERLDLKPKALFQPLRVAICGNMVSPPLFESIELIDRNDVLARIDNTLAIVWN